MNVIAIPRQAGKTHRLLEEARERAASGEKVTIVVGGEREARHIERKLRGGACQRCNPPVENVTVLAVHALRAGSLRGRSVLVDNAECVLQMLIAERGGGLQTMTVTPWPA